MIASLEKTGCVPYSVASRRATQDGVQRKEPHRHPSEGIARLGLPCSVSQGWEQRKCYRAGAFPARSWALHASLTSCSSVLNGASALADELTHEQAHTDGLSSSPGPCVAMVVFIIEIFHGKAPAASWNNVSHEMSPRVTSGLVHWGDSIGKV